MTAGLVKRFSSHKIKQLVKASLRNSKQKVEERWSS